MKRNIPGPKKASKVKRPTKNEKAFQEAQNRATQSQLALGIEVGRAFETISNIIIGLGADELSVAITFGEYDILVSRKKK